MGRGRQRAKQAKVARRLKYFSPETDYAALERELAGNKAEDDEYEDPYAHLYEDEDDDPYAEYAEYSADSATSSDSASSAESADSAESAASPDEK